MKSTNTSPAVLAVDEERLALALRVNETGQAYKQCEAELLAAEKHLAIANRLAETHSLKYGPRLTVLVAGIEAVRRQFEFHGQVRP